MHPYLMGRQSVVCVFSFCALLHHLHFIFNADAFMVQLDQDEQAVAEANMFSNVSNININ